MLMPYSAIGTSLRCQFAPRGATFFKMRGPKINCSVLSDDHFLKRAACRFAAAARAHREGVMGRSCPSRMPRTIRYASGASEMRQPNSTRGRPKYEAPKCASFLRSFTDMKVGRTHCRSNGGSGHCRSSSAMAAARIGETGNRKGGSAMHEHRWAIHNGGTMGWLPCAIGCRSFNQTRKI